MQVYVVKDMEKKFDAVGDLPFQCPLVLVPESEEDGMHRNSLLQFPAGPAYALTGHKAQGLTMFMTYISFLRFWGYGLPYTLATRTPFVHNIHFVGVPPRDIYESLLERGADGMNKIERKKHEIDKLLLDESALQEEVCRRIQQGEFKNVDKAAEIIIYKKIVDYYKAWSARLDTLDGLDNMTQVSTSFKLNRSELRRGNWKNTVTPYNSQFKTADERWPTLKQV